MARKYEHAQALLPKVKELREAGKTYKEIANELYLSDEEVVSGCAAGGLPESHLFRGQTGKRPGRTKPRGKLGGTRHGAPGCAEVDVPRETDRRESMANYFKAVQKTKNEKLIAAMENYKKELSEKER